VNVDSTNIRRAGTSELEFTGTSDAFQALYELRDELRTARGLSSSEFHDAMSRRITDLNRVRDSISDVVGQQSVELASLDALESRAQDLQLEAKRLISDLESADISETIINLQTEQNLLQFTYASSVRLFDMSLLDFLQ
jgi:flagellin-like hook-associated protein FlgL